MKTNSILNLIALVSLAASAHAEVVVYKGPSRIAADLTTHQALPNVIGNYIVVDYGAHTIGRVPFFQGASGKRYSPGGAGDIHITSAPLPEGKTVSIISNGFANEVSATNYAEGMALLRGTNRSLTIATAPTLVEQNLPRILSGVILNAGTDNAQGNFATQTFRLTLDAKKTIDANNANRTTQQALDDIEADLKAKGYVSL